MENMTTKDKKELRQNEYLKGYNKGYKDGYDLGSIEALVDFTENKIEEIQKQVDEMEESLKIEEEISEDDEDDESKHQTNLQAIISLINNGYIPYIYNRSKQHCRFDITNIEFVMLEKNGRTAWNKEFYDEKGFFEWLNQEFTGFKDDE